MNQPETYSFNCEEDKLLNFLRSHFHFSRHPVKQLISTYLDTFDWRLYKTKLLLRAERDEEQQRLGLSDFSGRYQASSMGGQHLDFVWNIPQGALRDRLKPIVQMRRLLPLVEVRSSGWRSDLQDTEAKTVVRLWVLQRSAVQPVTEESAALAPILQLVPVRGYDDAFEIVRDFVTEVLKLTPVPGNDLTTALEALGEEAASYTSKLRLQLHPSMAAPEAVRVILKTLFSSLVANEEGTVADWDTEFLHDFRVAVRRTRAVLGQLKKSLPAKELSHFRSQFSWLGKATGPLRDLDVYLLKMPRYNELLPPEANADLAPLIDFLRNQRKQELNSVKKILKSQRFRTLKQSWSEFLEQDWGKASSDQASALELASDRIWAIYRTIRKRGKRIHATSPSQDLHRLRLDCKKLRYLLEFFRSLYPKPEIKRLVRILKELQENLGDFNDLDLQITKVNRFAEAMVAEGRCEARTLLAMGRLIEPLESRQRIERAGFEARFRTFSSRSNRKLFRRLFKSSGEASSTS